MVASDIGTFIVNKNDTGVGWQLSEYGSHDSHELKIIRDVMRTLKKTKPNLVAADVGANIGIHSVVLSSEVGEFGRVHAFEPQRIIFNMLAGNMALNSISNVHCFHQAVSDSVGFVDIPQFDYGKPLSFGSVEFGGIQHESIGQEPMHDPARQEKVGTVTLDHLAFEQLDFLKIDV